MTVDGDGAATAQTVDLSVTSVRELNAALHEATAGSYSITNPAGRHNIAVGLAAPLDVEIAGHVGYYCAGMNADARVHVRGNVGPGVAENIMSGNVVVDGDASQSAGATGNGGLLVIHGSASARCGISMKGVDIVVRGSVGHLSAFMAQSGRLVICGDAGATLGDSIYEARLYVRGTVDSLGADCIEKPMQAEHLAELAELLGQAGIDDVAPESFRRFGSARTLYSFHVDDAGPYREHS